MLARPVDAGVLTKTTNCPVAVGMVISGWGEPLAINLPLLNWIIRLKGGFPDASVNFRWTFAAGTV